MADITKIRLSGVTYNIVDSSAIHSLDGYYTSAQTDNAITAATSALAQTIAEQGYQTSGDVQNAISGKADTSAVTESINAATSGKADTSAVTEVNNTLTAHTANTDIHVTVADKTAWNAKLDAADITGLFGVADYDSTTHRINFYNTSTGGTVLSYIDASPFLVDGMVENVVITSVTSGGSEVEVLEITFNTDAGKQAIDIPLSQIFNADNYYTTAQTQAYVTAYTYDKQTIDDKITQSGTFDPTQYYTTANTYSKTEVDNEISAATSGKSDTTAVTAINDTLTAHTADTSIHVTTSDKSTWNGKQDALVSGTNIKTVGGTTVLGSGNIALMTASIGTGNDSETLIFDFA